MSDYTTDEEKVEAIKRWWKENGTAVILGIVLGLGGLFGWRYWVDMNESRAERASDIYLGLKQAARTGAVEQVRLYTDTLRSDYARTPYASMAALEMARVETTRDDLAAAEEHLRWAVQNAPGPEVEWLARVRLGRVLVATERADEVLPLIETGMPPGFEGLVEELRGDVYRRQGDAVRALQAYERAIASSAGATEYLQMKRDEVAALATGDGA